MTDICIVFETFAVIFVHKAAILRPCYSHPDPLSPAQPPYVHLFNTHAKAGTHHINMSDLQATVAETETGFHVEGCERISYDFEFLDGVFDMGNSQLADCYQRWGRALAVMDANILYLYGEQMQAYFDHYNLKLSIHKTMIGEKAKSIDTLLGIVDSMNKFGVFRKEPVLVVGGGLVTDVAG